MVKPTYRGKGFVGCFRKCRINPDTSRKECGLKCLKKLNDKAKMLQKLLKERVSQMKLMADHKIPKHIIEEMLKKGIKFNGFKETKSMSDKDSFIDGNHHVVDPSKLWAQYRQEIFSFFRQGDKRSMKNMQLLTHPYPADDETLSLFLNYLPKWSTIYERTNDKISDNYDDFLMNIKINDPVWTPQLDALAEKLDIATGKMENEINNCLMKYEAILPNQYKPNFEMYKKTRCYSVERTTAEQRKAFFMFEQARKQVQGKGTKVYDAKINYFNAQGNYNFITFGKVSDFKQAAQEQRVNAFQITLHHASSTSIQTTYSSSMGFDVNAAISGVKLGVSGQFERSKMKLTTSQKEFHVKVGAAGYLAMPVIPGNWYDGRITRDYKDGPFVKPPTSPYWGPKGSLRLLPKTLFVIVGPKVEMWVSRDDKEQLETMKNNSIKANIGYMDVFGLNFDFKKGSTMKSEIADNKLYKIEINGNGYEPQILAIDYESPNYQ